MKSIPSILITNRYTDTVLKFSEGHIYVHWIILEVNKTSIKWLTADMIWWTLALARDTNSDNIVKVILPEVSTKVILREVGSCQLLHNEA